MKHFLIALISAIFIGNSLYSVADSPSEPIQVYLAEYLNSVQNTGRGISYEDYEIRELERQAIKSGFVASIVENINTVRLSDLAIERSKIENKMLSDKKPESATPPPNPFGGINMMNGQHNLMSNGASFNNSTSLSDVAVFQISGNQARISIDGVTHNVIMGSEINGLKILAIGNDQITISENGKSRKISVQQANVRSVPVVRALNGVNEQ